MKLKQVLLAAFATVLLSSNAKAQTTIKDLFNAETQVTYFGIDFSQLRYIGDQAAKEEEIRDNHFPGINDVVVNEPKKFKLAAAFHKSRIDTDLEEVHKKNAKVDADKIKSSKSADFHRLTPDDVVAVVKGYSFSGYKGLGILFIAEAYSKTEKTAAYYVTVTDLASKKVLLVERVTVEQGKLPGFTWRNVWANTVKDLLEKIDKTSYKAWKAKYGGGEE